jgi:hypothetical protein
MHHNAMAAQPTGIWEYIIVTLAIAVFLLSIYLCLKFFISPGEDEKDHIKKKILEDDVTRTER